MQVILAAIEKSDGTRKGVPRPSEGEGITIPADQAVLGKEIKIDPTTGDVTAKDISILLVKDGKETFFKAQSLLPLIDSRRARGVPGPAVRVYAPSQSVCSRRRSGANRSRGTPHGHSPLAAAGRSSRREVTGPDHRAVLGT